MTNTTDFCFSPTHIDISRNSTDDFNPFHDQRRYQQIANNPFSRPIVLGFQQLAFIADRIKQYRHDHNELLVIERENLRYSYYQVSFASALHAGDKFNFEIKKSKFKSSDNSTLSNRFLLKSDKGMVTIGYKRESQKPSILEFADFSQFSSLTEVSDRTYIEGTNFFVKRKYLTTSNGKNFLVGCLVDQSSYFDELEDYVSFPETFPLALISCALLERATYNKHDFLKNPMVYVSQELCVDKLVNAKLKSNDSLIMLVEKQENGEAMETYNCYGLLDNETILYRCIINLAPLHMVLKN